MTTNNSIQLSPWATDETGNVYTRLTALRRNGTTQAREAMWLCRCECGNTITAVGRNLRRGYTKSCGCLLRSANSGSKTLEYYTWVNMRTRCYNPQYALYHRYGGRGISVCQRWRRSFVHFLADMGPKPFPEASIDRIDNDGNYSCGQCEQCIRNNWTANCRWATPTEQSRNSARVRLLTHNGITMPIVDWARKLGLRPNTLSARLKYGWSVEKTLTVPVI